MIFPTGYNFVSLESKLYYLSHVKHIHATLCVRSLDCDALVFTVLLLNHYSLVLAVLVPSWGLTKNELKKSRCAWASNTNWWEAPKGK